MMRQVFLNGAFMAEDSAKISIFDRSVQFADSIYEVLAVIDGKIVDFAGHINRLDRSMEKMALSGGPSHEIWLTIFRRLIADNRLKEGIIYLQISRGTAERDFQFPPQNMPLTIMAYTQEKNLIDNPKCANGFSIMFAPDLRWGRCDIKTTQLLYASMMKSEAAAQGYDDAWLVRDDIITEGTSNNAAIITHDDELITHEISPAILTGTTRNIILDLASDLPLKITERPFTTQEALAAKEAFASAASLFVMPVSMICDQKVGMGVPGPFTMQLRQNYIDWARKTSL